MFLRFDTDKSESIDFEEFLLIIGLLVACRDGKEMEFIIDHILTIFQIIDEDCSTTVSAKELGELSFLFNLHQFELKAIFTRYDVTGDNELDYEEFSRFAILCNHKKYQNTKENVRWTIQQMKKEKSLLDRFFSLFSNVLHH
ncbi:hypothetical protein GJ496_007004 [Pomphorhynchus laevis]|nr:hypothetical protein GJ496_007004 [Pomphorhynchus laevis]